MRSVLRLFKPPEWDLWTLVERVVYVVVFMAIMLTLRWALHGLIDPLADRWR